MNYFFGGAAADDPISQFKIKSLLDIDIGGLQLDFTNSTFWMIVGVLLIITFFTMAANRKALVPGRLQSLGELSYTFIADMIRGISGEEGLKFFPLVFTLFFFVLFANMIGMLPFAFTTTSHIAVTATLALMVIFIVIGYGFYKNGFGFLKLFVPSGVPLALIPAIFLIEVISFLARPLTLSLRLFANMLAGHIALKLFAGFAVMLIGSGGVVFIPVAALSFLTGTALNGLEFLVSAVQAFVFAILTVIYLNDALHPSH
ncbi:MAG: F0F1 ATP synthase subunit A [Pseudomonadota bacterium]